jgi:hypothetical protein
VQRNPASRCGGHAILVTSQSNSTNFTTKLQLGNALVLIVVPDHDFVRWVLGITATTDKRQNITPPQHFDDTDTGTIKLYNPPTRATRMHEIA